MVSWSIVIVGAVVAGAFYRLIVVSRILAQARSVPHLPLHGRTTGPLVSIVVPARNEADEIDGCLRSLLVQEYDPFEIVMVDDASDDETATIVEAIAERDRRVKLLHVDGPPPGWSGKCYALSVGAEAAKGEWLLFTDADTRHRPSALATAVAHASANGIGMLSLTGEQRAVSFWERVIQPVAFGLLDEWYPLGRVNDPGSPLAAANGIFILIRRDVYESVGGHRAVAGEILEDVALARAVKSRGYRICFAPGSRLVAARMYRGFREVREGWTKNLYLLAGRRIDRIMGRSAELFLTAILPALSLSAVGAFSLAGAATPRSALAALLAALILAFSVERLYRGARGGDPGMAWSHPIGAACVLFFLLESMARHRLGLGVTWKERLYKADEQT